MEHQDAVAQIDALTGRSVIAPLAVAQPPTVHVELRVSGGSVHCWQCERELGEPKLIAARPHEVVEDADHVTTRQWVVMLCPNCEGEILRFQTELNYESH